MDGDIESIEDKLVEQGHDRSLQRTTTSSKTIGFVCGFSGQVSRMRSANSEIRVFEDEVAKTDDSVFFILR